MRAIKDIVIHCAATPNGKPVSIATVDRWHASRGFRRSDAARARLNPTLGAVGYHYVIDVDGEVHSGRHEDEIGAHVQGSNARSIGVCMIGTDKFTQAQWDSLSRLITELLAGYPTAKVSGHRDFSPDLNGDGIIQRNEWTKTCPGFDAAAWLYRGRVPAAENLL
jgi:N-acetylmuramoyl-L-alanine amidase